MKTFKEVLDEYGMQFIADISEEQRRDIEGFWQESFSKQKGEIPEKDILDLLAAFTDYRYIEKKRRRNAAAGPSDGETILVLEAPAEESGDGVWTGTLYEPKDELFFELQKDEGDDAPAEHRTVVSVTEKYANLVRELLNEHLVLELGGHASDGKCTVTDIHICTPDDDFSTAMRDPFLQMVLERLRTSQIYEDDGTPEPEKLTQVRDIERYLTCAGQTLPVDIRRWAVRTLKSLDSQEISATEKLHAQRALTMMMNIRWESRDFPPIDPKEARRILDSELYGLDAVKQRVIETIIQMNRTHTLPSYGLLLIGPPGTGKSRIAYAVARILKLPSTVLDMSTIRDPEALTGSSRVYVNARPGRIMEAFNHAGSSNLVFIVNELDKADAESSHGSSSDVLLTLLDNLGFTDVYMECAIPTSGVFTIATANEIEKISGPLLSRFSVIRIPDYTPEEKKIILRDYSVPRIFSRMGLSTDECVLTDKGLDYIIRRFHMCTGCRELEQAAEHIAGNALYHLETDGCTSITYGPDELRALLG